MVNPGHKRALLLLGALMVLGLLSCATAASAVSVRKDAVPARRLLSNEYYKKNDDHNKNKGNAYYKNKRGDDNKKVYQPVFVAKPVQLYHPAVVAKHVPVGGYGHKRAVLSNDYNKYYAQQKGNQGGKGNEGHGHGNAYNNKRGDDNKKVYQPVFVAKPVQVYHPAVVAKHVPVGGYGHKRAVLSNDYNKYYAQQKGNQGGKGNEGHGHGNAYNNKRGDDNKKVYQPVFVAKPVQVYHPAVVAKPSHYGH